MPEFTQRPLDQVTAWDAGQNSRSKLDVVASPVNTFVEPGENKWQRLGAALGTFTNDITPAVREYSAEQKHKQSQDDVAAAIKQQASDAAAGTSSEAAVSQEASPEYRAAYMQSHGTMFAANDLAEWQKTLDDNKHDPSFDLNTFRSKRAEMLNSLGNKDAALAYAHATSGFQAEATQHYYTAQKAQQQESLKEDFNAQVSTVINSSGPAADKHKTLFALTDQYSKNLGLPREQAESVIAKGVLAQVSASGDLGPLEILMSKDTPSGMSLADRLPDGWAHVQHAASQAQAVNHEQLKAARAAQAENQMLEWQSIIANPPSNFDVASYVQGKDGGEGSYWTTEKKAGAFSQYKSSVDSANKDKLEAIKTANEAGATGTMLSEEHLLDALKAGEVIPGYTTAENMILSQNMGPGAYYDANKPDHIRSSLERLKAAEVSGKKTGDFNKMLDRDPSLFSYLKNAGYTEEAKKYEEDFTKSNWLSDPTLFKDPSKLARAIDGSMLHMDKIKHPDKNMTTYLEQGLAMSTSGKDGVGTLVSSDNFKIGAAIYDRMQSANNQFLGEVISPEKAEPYRAFNFLTKNGQMSEDQARTLVQESYMTPKREGTPMGLKPEVMAGIDKAVNDEFSKNLSSVRGLLGFDVSDTNSIRDMQADARQAAAIMFKTRNVTPQQAAEYGLNFVKQSAQTVDGGKGHVSYRPGAYSGKLTKEEFGRAIDGQLNGFKGMPEFKSVNNIQAYTDNVGTVHFRDVDGLRYMGSKTPAELTAEYQRPMQQDLEISKDLRNALNDPSVILSTTEVARLLPAFDMLYKQNKLNGDSPEVKRFVALEYKAKQLDDMRMTNINTMMAKSKSILDHGQIPADMGYNTDVMSPTGTNLKAIDYAKGFFKNKDTNPIGLTASLTMINEGLALRAYDDNKGRAIGIGYNMTLHGPDVTKRDLMMAGVSASNVPAVIAGTTEISKDQALALFKNTMEKEYVPIAKRAYGNGYDQLPAEAKAVLNDLAYNAGGNIKKFTSMIDAMKSGDLQEAAKHIDLTYVNRQGVRVRNGSRIKQLQLMLAGQDVWGTYLENFGKQSKH